jgi:hypothetical protein
VSLFHFGGSPVHVATVTKSLVLLLFFQAEFLFVGVTFLSYWASARYARFKLFDQAFVGYCLVSGFAQLWSVFGGLRPLSNFCLIGGTLVLAILNRQRVANYLFKGAGRVRTRALLVLAPIGLSVAFNVLTSDLCYDGMLYHHLSVRWITEYGSVTGLANLHGRLGFNSSLAPLAGIFSVPFGLPVGREFANGATTFLVACVLSQGLTFKNLTALTCCRNLYAFGLLTFLLMLVVSPCLSSPQPDVSSAAVTVAATWYFFEFLVSCRTADLEAANHLFLCVAASVAAFELKISYIGFAAATILVALGIALRRGGFVSPIAFCLLFSAGLLVPWISCGYITSGCPFFPSEFGRLGFDWAVPHELAGLEKDAAFAWARTPGLPPAEVLRNWEWITPWWIRLLGSPLVVKPMLVAVVGLSLMLARFLMPPRPQIDRPWLVLLIPCSAGLCFWFLTAPDPRFAQATFWVFALNILLLPFLTTGSFSRLLALPAALVLAVVAIFDTGIGVVRLIQEKKSLPNIVRGQADLSARRTDSGLTVWIPKNVYEPGFAQLISTPPDRFNSGLELRDSNLRDGFRIRASSPHRPEISKDL